VALNGAVYVHGSPQSDVRSFFPTPAEDEDELLDSVDSPRLVFGHTHLPFRRVNASMSGLGAAWLMGMADPVLGRLWRPGPVLGPRVGGGQTLGLAVAPLWG
jgi:hypothetical protein